MKRKGFPHYITQVPFYEVEIYTKKVNHLSSPTYLKYINKTATSMNFYNG